MEKYEPTIVTVDGDKLQKESLEDREKRLEEEKVQVRQTQTDQQLKDLEQRPLSQTRKHR